MPAPSADQLAASDPARSVWVAANAGSGKTTVLVNRVVRLLLRGADPARILCVTYTKAAAANMQDRIFAKLGAWVALPDAELLHEIAEIEGAAPGPAALAVARQLFARAVETPGGLKIQTIHALCERLLHLFPFEAAVPARFEMLDEAQTAAMQERAMAATLRAALADGPGPLAEALRTVTDAAGEDGVREAIASFVRHRRGLQRRAPGRKFAVPPLRAALGVAPGVTLAEESRKLFDEGLPGANWSEVANWLATGTKTDRDNATVLNCVLGPEGDRDEDAYCLIFLTEKGLPRKKLVTNTPAKARPDLADLLVKEQERIITFTERMRAIAAAERTEAITLLADDVLARTEAEKRWLGRLDFQDLIMRARALLTSDAARWVLFKLDQGVDHLLVDEAQDTSPEQWDIVKALTDEFFDGAGARSTVTRTVFAVGDEKQSIFGFQGAKPEEFDLARRHFEGRVATFNTDAERKHDFGKIELHTSYRTTPDVLAAVDQIFSLPDNFAGLESQKQRTVHVTSRASAPGLVELWPVVEPEGTEEVDPSAPLDTQPAESPQRRLADRIARRIRWWLDHETRLEADGKPIRPEDVLILVRSRGAVFDGVIKALKHHRVPVAGADRMKLTEQIAVMDLLSLGRFCVLPEDDLALAEVLRSPMVDLTEGQLLQVAHGRGDRTLWAALQARPEPEFSKAARTLEAWRQMAAGLDPLRFYGEVLAAGGLRRRLLARLGSDAAEALDVFTYRLRQWQGANPPSLLLFLEAMQGDDSDVKRDMEEAHGRVRVMTVHGSKGLEAKVVFLADLFRSPTGGKTERLVEIDAGDGETAVWTPRKEDDPAVLAQGRARLAALAAAEHRRLLYVGLTRARDRLYLAGAKGKRKVDDAWHSLIDAALAGDGRLATVPDETGDGEVRQWRSLHVAAEAPVEVTSPAIRQEAFPWLHEPAGADLSRPPPIRPSRLADAAEEPVLRETSARRSVARLRGDLIHLLLQHLPGVLPDRRAQAGERLAAARYPALTPAIRADALAATLALTDDPRWAPLFGSDARVEVDIAGRVKLGGRQVEVSGRIDRLLLAPDRVMVMDFKTGRVPEDPQLVPESHLRQMAVYAALLQDLYPGRVIEAAIIWTGLPALVVLEARALAGALERLGTPQADQSP